jgi:parallel beta-helix repeat protein
MAYIKYCDYINGNDSTGDGSAGNPYKTITKASTGLTGGDEVRVAKSPDPTNLAGTLSFTQNNTAVVSTSAIFVNAVSGGETDGSVRLGDFIKGGDGNWWEVVTVTDSTHATLYKKYSGATQSGVSSQKLGITSTGAAASSSTQVQVVSASGTSSSKLKISGGWDLSGPTQNGQTYFRQMNATFSYRYGYGLYLSYKSYVEIERCNFLRYNYGIYLYSSSNNTITTPTCNSNGESIRVHYSSNNTIITPTCNSNNYGILLQYSLNNTITTPICNSNDNSGIYLLTSSNNTITTPTCNSNNSNGIQLETSSNNTIITPTCNSNNYGIFVSNSSNNVADKYSGTGNTTDVYVFSGQHYGEYPCLKCQHFKTAGVNKCFYEYGTTERDTANARSGECLKYTPTSAIYYISQSFFFKADSGVSQTLSAYIKDDASFNGDVQAAIYFMGEKITGWTEWTPTTSYEQKSIVASSGSITEDGILELRIKCRGSSGNVFIDDISARVRTF